VAAESETEPVPVTVAVAVIVLAAAAAAVARVMTKGRRKRRVARFCMVIVSACLVGSWVAVRYERSW